MGSDPGTKTAGDASQDGRGMDRRYWYAIIALNTVYVLVWVVGVWIGSTTPDGAEPPIFDTLTKALAIYIVAGPFVYGYLIDADKQELGKVYDTDDYGWITINSRKIAILIVFVLHLVTLGLYAPWYQLRRWLRYRTAEPDRPVARADREPATRQRPHRGQTGEGTADAAARQADDRQGDAPQATAGDSSSTTRSSSQSRGSRAGGDTSQGTPSAGPEGADAGGTTPTRASPPEATGSVDLRAASIPAEDAIPSPPDVSVDYDRLTDHQPIGSGGNADVVRATLPTDDGEVVLAIKEPRMAGTLHTEAIDRLLTEAETWDKVDDHDHVVGVVDYGSEPLPWIAMEYMDGGHLGERDDGMPLDQRLWTAVAITRGVRHAHRRGVAHLDLKPENVLFRGVDDAWDVPKVADWGLSKHLLDHSASVEGLSPHYAAPEQFDDDLGPADDITDVYQLGAVFYELFTGRPPFEGNATQVMRSVMDERPTPPSEVADVPEPLDDVVLTALAKSRSDRYDNVSYLRDGLQAVYDDRQ